MTTINASVEVVGISGAVVEVPITATVGAVPINAQVDAFQISAAPGPIQVNASVSVPEINVQISGGAIKPEDDVAFAKRIDFITDQLFYRGEAVPGALESAGVWRVARITIANDDDVTEEWADGVATFTKVWDDRLTFTYS
jgi:hypothetical protein